MPFGCAGTLPSHTKDSFEHQPHVIKSKQEWIANESFRNGGILHEFHCSGQRLPGTFFGTFFLSLGLFRASRSSSSLFLLLFLLPFICILLSVLILFCHRRASSSSSSSSSLWSSSWPLQKHVGSRMTCFKSAGFANLCQSQSTVKENLIQRF
jgi:hypothetical protein